jgi:hypothetical protein
VIIVILILVYVCVLQTQPVLIVHVSKEHLVMIQYKAVCHVIVMLQA